VVYIPLNKVHVQQNTAASAQIRFITSTFFIIINSLLFTANIQTTTGTAQQVQKEQTAQHVLTANIFRTLRLHLKFAIPAHSNRKVDIAPSSCITLNLPELSCLYELIVTYHKKHRAKPRMATARNSAFCMSLQSVLLIKIESNANSAESNEM
jgi:hypothetical protein